jgi:hypothetical protein
MSCSNKRTSATGRRTGSDRALVCASVLGLITLLSACLQDSRKDKVSEILGDSSTASIIRSAEKVELFPTVYTYWMKTNGSGSVPADSMESVGPGTNLPPVAVRQITRILLAAESYQGPTNYVRNDVFEPEFVLKFSAKKRSVEFVLSVGSGGAVIKSGHMRKSVDLFPVKKELARVMKPYVTITPYTWDRLK